jgi:protein tyrosine phosphatase (PTP) superfamily phosphohydrolase (DUF442 family)
MGYNKIQENLIVGSQPESDDDIQRLKDEGVKVILNLQTDDDINNSKFLVESRKGKWEGLGIRYERVPVCFSQQKGTSTFQTQIVWL